MNKEHTYKLSIEWTGNKGQGTADYRSYGREHIISGEGKIVLQASSDPSFRGDKTKYNPEELLVASISGCHLLWFLHFCADEGIIVLNYKDKPVGIMTETDDGSGKFSEVTLYPEVEVADSSMLGKIDAIHSKANKYCFIANSVNFPVHHNSTNYSHNLTTTLPT